MMKKVNKGNDTTWKRVVIVIVIAILEFLFINWLVALGLAPGDRVDSTLSMLLTCVSYLVISGIFLWRGNPLQAFWTAVVAFVFLCIFLLYAISITDLLAFLVCVTVVLSSMTILDTKMKEKEQKENEKK